MDFARPEHELLILLSRKNIESSVKERIDVLSNGEMRWNQLFTTAYNHGVFPLIFTNWRDCISTGLGESELGRWEQTYRGIKTHNIVLTMELVTILQRLQLANVTAIPLKGPVLTHLIYGDVGLRMFSDLDILVLENQVSQALDVLLSKGYFYSEVPSGQQRQTIKPRMHHYSLTNKNGIHVELHRTLEPPYYLARGDADAFWKDIKTIPCFGTAVTQPRDEETLLFLCRHGSRHLWGSLKWLADVDQFLNNVENLDWSYISTRVERSHTRRLVYLGLYLTNQLYASVLPVEVSQEIKKDKTLQEIGAEILGHLFSAPATGDAANPERYLADRVRLIQLREGQFQRLKFIYGDLIRSRLNPTAEDKAMVQLPAHLSFLYYILRPFRLLVAYGGMFIKSMNK